MYTPPCAIEPNPALKALAERLFGYRGRTFNVQSHDAPFTLHDVTWGGGTRSEWIVIEGDGAYDFSAQAAMFAPPAISVDITPNTILAEHVIFCGRDLGVRLHVHPSRLPKLLPPPATINRNQLIVLASIREYKNTYGGRTGIRFEEAHRETGIHATEYAVARQECIEQGWLNRAGVMQPAGSQALGTNCLHTFRKEAK